MKPLRLSRRALLRGAGVAIGLPVLDAMLDSKGLLLGHARAAAPGAPVYLMAIMAPNGSYTIDWYPAEVGPNYRLIPTVQRGTNWLEPLEPHRDEFQVLSGLAKEQALLSKDLAQDAHLRGTATFATGEAVTATGAGGPSIDQIAAAELGGDTRFRSVAAAIGGVTEPHWSYISWGGRDQPVPPYRDPAQLFHALFADMPEPTSPAPDDGESPSEPPPRSLRDYRKSVLDFVKSDLGRLQPRLGSEDRARLDAHLTAIRELEKQVLPQGGGGGGSGGGGGEGPGDPDAPTNDCRKPDAPTLTEPMSNERIQSFLKLQVLAMACDFTRFTSFQMGGRADERLFSWLGMREGHHSISHDYTEPGEAKRELMWRDEIEQLAWLLDTMKQTRVSAEESLLDRAVVLFASEHGQSMEDGHYMGDIPLILAGRGGGQLRTGQHVRFDAGSGYTYSDVLLTILQVLGTSATSFGPYGTKPVAPILV